MRKKITFFIIFSAIILAIGCTSKDSMGGGELVQVADAVEEEIKEPIEDIKEEIVEETKEEPAEEIIKESEEDKIEEPTEEIIDEATEDVKEELPETKEESTEQTEEPTEEESQVAEEEKVEEKVEDNKEVEDSQPEYYWILNTNTKKVHNPTCNSVKQMKEKNKKESNLSPEELKKKGYSACNNCKPF